MKVKCVICEVINVLDEDSVQAKRLRNRPIHTYLCLKCTDRIAKKTNDRIATGKFNLNEPQKEEDDW